MDCLLRNGGSFFAYLSKKEKPATIPTTMQATTEAKTQATANIFKILMKLGPTRLACLFFLLFEVPGLNDILFVLLFFLFFLAAIISFHAWPLTSGEYAASTIFEHTLLIVNPAFAAALGKSECVVNPGIVLSSST